MSLHNYCYILAIVELLIGIPMLVRPERTSEWFLQLQADDNAVRIIGGLLLVISCLVLFDDPSIGTTVAGLIRLIAWISVVKSLTFCWRPTMHLAIKQRMLQSHFRRYVMGTVLCTWGILFLLAGRALTGNVLQ